MDEYQQSSPSAPNAVKGSPTQAYDSFIDFEGFPSSATIDDGSPRNKISESKELHYFGGHNQSPPQQQQPMGSKDQQIFRRAPSSGSAGTPSYTTGSTSTGEKEGRCTNNNNSSRGGIIFESYEASTNNNSPSNNSNSVGSMNNSRDFGGSSQNNNRRSGASILDNIAEVAQHQRRVDNAMLNDTQMMRLINNNHIGTATARSTEQSNCQSHNTEIFNQKSPVLASISDSASKEKQLVPGQNSSPSISPQQQHSKSMLRKSKPGSVVVNKLVSMFSNANITNQQQHRSNQSNRQSSTTSSSQPMQNSKITTTTTYNTHNNNNNPPAISPARSNAQSSVTGYSGDGWPGTVDKRGRTYMMEPSYSESEGESMASPQRRWNRATTVGSGNNNMDQGEQTNFPMQNYCQGSKFNATATMQSEPIDLDEAYNNGIINEGKCDPIDLDDAYEGWREGRRDESKTAAGIQLVDALRMTTANHIHGQQQQLETPPPPTNEMLEENTKLRGIDLSGSEKRVRASRRRLPSPNIYNEEVDFDATTNFHIHNNNKSYKPQQRKQEQQQPQLIYNGHSQPLSEEAIRLNDSQSAPPRAGGNVMLRGYRGFIDKTKDVPNLMDDLESEASMGTGVYSTDLARRQQHTNNMGLFGLVLPTLPDSGSDVFDGIQEESFRLKVLEEQQCLQSLHFEGEKDDLPYSTQNNPFASSRTTKPKYYTANFMDHSLNISAVTNGSETHHLDDVDEEKEVLSLPDLSIYTIQPEMVTKLVRAFRKICTNQMEMTSSEENMLSNFENVVDIKKAFALCEMRSRIMETDIDRGLERRGGTNVVDDIVLTPYFQAASRVRDAVIVSKAWRDGATPKDVTTAYFLTRRSAKAYFVKRPIQRIKCPGMHFDSNDIMHRYWREEVKWLDDTDFMQMRCQSIGGAMMKGFEMFTIGDCQSILLRMTSDNCTELRRELRRAMMHQIEAEELMQDEMDKDGDEMIMLEVEHIYREATADVKTLSIKLVLADKAFQLVRNRMEQLVETIESLLIQVDDDNTRSDGEEVSSSSEVSEEEEYDVDVFAEFLYKERNKLDERAKRAELSAELAVREVRLAKQEAENIKLDKQREIDELKRRLVDMETMSQLSERHQLYYNGIQTNTSYFLDDAKSFLESTFDMDKEEDRKNRLKQQFRERRNVAAAAAAAKPNAKAGDFKDSEEMYNSLDFYSRSLNAVNN